MFSQGVVNPSNGNSNCGFINCRGFIAVFSFLEISGKEKRGEKMGNELSVAGEGFEQFQDITNALGLFILFLHFKGAAAGGLDACGIGREGHAIGIFCRGE